MWSMVLASMVVAASAHTHSHVVDRRQLQDSVERCVQDDEPSDDDIQHRVSEAAEFRFAYQAREADLTRLVVPTIFHVIHAGNTGKLSSQRITDQMDILNLGFGGDQDRQITTDNTGIQFELEEINYIENSDWYYNCKASSYTFRPAHVRDTSKYLNVFTCSGDGYLGWTWLPWTHGEGSNMQAVIVNQNSLPGGTFSKYSLGYTLVHETGHYFGLLHTFARGVCTGVGDDGVDDTPLEARGGSSCGTNFDDYTRDTCTNDPGADPLWSFMDYSYDQCMQRFSAGQVARMREMTDLHRPGLVANSFAGYLNSAPATSAPTAQPTDAPTDAPTTRSPTAVPTNSPTAEPTVESSIVITSHSTKLYQSQTGVVSINYQYSTLLPLVVKAEVHNEAGLWVGGSVVTPLPRSSLRTGTGTIDLTITLHGKPFAAKNYKVSAWLMREDDLHKAAPWTLRMSSEVSATLLEVVADIADGGEADSTGQEPNTAICAEFAAANVNWKIRSASGSGTGQTSTLKNICAGSKSIDGACFGQSSHATAAETCTNIGARLCTAEELFNGVAKDTGCQSNSKYHWTSSACAAGYLVLPASPEVQGLAPKCLDPSKTSATESEVTTICCADNILPPTPSPTPAPTDMPTLPKPNAECLDRVSSESCGRWKVAGFCSEESLYHNYMELNCKGTCNLCTTTTPEPEVAVDECTVDVKEECTLGENSALCCAGIAQCTVWGGSGGLKCKVPNPAGNALYPDGERCNGHRQCASGYCDKLGVYGDRFRCYTASSKSEGDEQASGKLSGAGETTVTAVVAVAAGLIVAILALVVYQRHREHDLLPSTSTDASSSVTGSFAYRPKSAGPNEQGLEYDNMISELMAVDDAARAATEGTAAGAATECSSTV
eukprot:m.39554 g.39554  ORF g.39554 m.39554 type:complete len:889 (-) comp7974_c0_seq1:216-2882(-)